MLIDRLTTGALVALVMVPVLGALEPTSVLEAFQTAVPCTSASLPRPAAPRGLRIVGGDAELDVDSELTTHGPFARPEPAPAYLDPDYPYFDMLWSRPDCFVAHSMRSDEDLASIKTGGTIHPTTLPVVYDGIMDAARFSIDGTGTTPGSGALSTPQKHIPINVLQTSLLITWDMRFDNGWRYVNDSYIPRHKSWWISLESAGWCILKADYFNATRAGRGIAELLLTMPGHDYVVPGQSNRTDYGAEILAPRRAQFYMEANTWTRYWMFVEGRIGGGIGGETVQFSAWAADSERDPILLYDRVPLYTPTSGFAKFRFAFDTSSYDKINPLSNAWQRNFVALKGVTLADVKALLQRPPR